MYQFMSPVGKKYGAKYEKKIEICLGDITQPTADAIVVPEGTTFRHMGFVAKRLTEIDAKYSKIRESLVNKNGSFESWEVYTRKFGKKYTYVICAIVPPCGNVEEWKDKMKLLYKRIFQEADRKAVTRLAVPLLGSGRGGASVEDAIESAVTSAFKFKGAQLKTVMFVSNDSEIVELMANAGELECTGGGHQSGPQARPSSGVVKGGRPGSHTKPTVNKPHHYPSGHFSSSDVSHRQSGASDNKKNQGSAGGKVRENGEKRLAIAGKCIRRPKRGTKARPPSGVDNRVPSGSNPQQSVGKQHNSSLGHLSSSDISHRQVGASDNMERQGNTRGKVRGSGEEGIQNILQEDQSILNRFTGQKHVPAVAAPRRQDVSPSVTRESNRSLHQFNHELGRHMQLSKGYDHSYETQTFQDLDSLDFDKMKKKSERDELLLNSIWEKDKAARRRKTEIKRTNGSVTNLSSTESESAVWYDDPAHGAEHTQEHIRRKQYSNEWNEYHENVPGQCMQLSKGYDHSYETRAFQDLDRIQNKSEEDEQQNFKWEEDQAARRRKAELKRTNGNVTNPSSTKSESAVWYTDDPTHRTEHTTGHRRRRQYSNEWNEYHEHVPGGEERYRQDTDHGDTTSKLTEHQVHAMADSRITGSENMNTKSGLEHRNLRDRKVTSNKRSVLVTDMSEKYTKYENNNYEGKGARPKHHHYSAQTDSDEETEDQLTKTKSSSSKQTCPICLDDITDPKQLEKCGHVFCRDCIDDSFNNFKPVCPSCNMVYGVLTGNQPDGNMDVRFSGDHLPGYEGHGTITITYYFPSGIQGSEHPNPGQPYKGTTRRAYLPDCSEGRKVLRLLKTAWDRKLTFTIGRSTTTGQENVVTWNDIHHKTNMDGGPTRFGYPDPGYLSRVIDELACKGVTE